MSRINTNVSALIANNSLQRNIVGLDESLQRLSTGLRINSGRDDPAGLIASELLRSDITAIGKSVSNTERATSVINTADSALQNISDMLINIQGLAIEAANRGGMSPEQTAANQLQLDSALEAIDRLSKTTQFQGNYLLNGSMDFEAVGLEQSGINDLLVTKAVFSTNEPVQIEAQILAPPERAELVYQGKTLDEDTTINVRGARGAEHFSFAGGATVDEMAAAINQVSDSTGVEAELYDNARATEVTVSSTDPNAAIQLTMLNPGTDGNQYDFEIVASGSAETTASLVTSGGPDAKQTIRVEAATEPWAAASAHAIDDEGIDVRLGISDVTIQGDCDYTFDMFAGQRVNYRLCSENLETVSILDTGGAPVGTQTVLDSYVESNYAGVTYDTIPGTQTSPGGQAASWNTDQIRQSMIEISTGGGDYVVQGDLAINGADFSAILDNAGPFQDQMVAAYDIETDRVYLCSDATTGLSNAELNAAITNLYMIDSNTTQYLGRMASSSGSPITGGFALGAGDSLVRNGSYKEYGLRNTLGGSSDWFRFQYNQTSVTLSEAGTTPTGTDASLRTSLESINDNGKGLVLQDNLTINGRDVSGILDEHFNTLSFNGGLTTSNRFRYNFTGTDGVTASPAGIAVTGGGAGLAQDQTTVNLNLKQIVATNNLTVGGVDFSDVLDLQDHYRLEYNDGAPQQSNEFQFDFDAIDSATASPGGVVPAGLPATLDAVLNAATTAVNANDLPLNTQTGALAMTINGRDFSTILNATPPLTDQAIAAYDTATNQIYISYNADTAILDNATINAALKTMYVVDSTGGAIDADCFKGRITDAGADPITAGFDIPATTANLQGDRTNLFQDQVVAVYDTNAEQTYLCYNADTAGLTQAEINTALKNMYVVDPTEALVADRFKGAITSATDLLNSGFNPGMGTNDLAAQRTNEFQDELKAVYDTVSDQLYLCYNAASGPLDETAINAAMNSLLVVDTTNPSPDYVGKILNTSGNDFINTPYSIPGGCTTMTDRNTTRWESALTTNASSGIRMLIESDDPVTRPVDQIQLIADTSLANGTVWAGYSGGSGSPGVLTLRYDGSGSTVNTTDFYTAIETLGFSASGISLQSTGDYSFLSLDNSLATTVNDLFAVKTVGPDDPGISTAPIAITTSPMDWEFVISSELPYNVESMTFVQDPSLGATYAAASFDTDTGLMTIRYNVPIEGNEATALTSSHIATAIENIDGFTVQSFGAFKVYDNDFDLNTNTIKGISVKRAKVPQENNTLNITARIDGSQFNNADVNIVEGNWLGTYEGIDHSYALAESIVYGESGDRDATFAISAQYGGMYDGQDGNDLQLQFVQLASATDVGLQLNSNVLSITSNFDTLTAEQLVNAIRDTADPVIAQNVTARIPNELGSDGSGVIGSLIADTRLNQENQPLGNPTTPSQAMVQLGTMSNNFQLSATAGERYDGTGSNRLKLTLVDVAPASTAAILDLRDDSLSIQADLDNSIAADIFDGNITIIEEDGTVRANLAQSELDVYVQFNYIGASFNLSSAKADLTSNTHSLQQLAAVATDTPSIDALTVANWAGAGDPNALEGVGMFAETVRYVEEPLPAVACVVGINDDLEDVIALSMQANFNGPMLNNISVQLHSNSGLNQNQAVLDLVTQTLKVYGQYDGTDDWNDVVLRINAEETFSVSLDSDSGLADSLISPISTKNVFGAALSPKISQDEIGNTGASGAEANSLMVYVDTGYTRASDVIHAMQQPWNAEANALFDIESTEGSDGSGLMYGVAHHDALSGGVNGGAITATAADVVQAIKQNSTICELVQAEIPPGTTGLGIVSTVQESAIYGDPKLGTGLQFLGPNDPNSNAANSNPTSHTGTVSPAIRFVTGEPDQPLSIDTRSQPTVYQRSSATLTANGPDASLVFTAENDGPQYDDVTVRFRAAEIGQAVNAATYSPQPSAAEAYMTFSNFGLSTDCDMILTASEHGDPMNHVDVQMRMQLRDESETDMFIDPKQPGQPLRYDDGTEVRAIAEYDPTGGVMTLVLKSDLALTDLQAYYQSADSITASDIALALNYESTFHADLDFTNPSRANSGLGNGFGTMLYDQATSIPDPAFAPLILSNTGETGGHQGGVLELTLGKGRSTAADVIDLLQGDSPAARQFLAHGISPSRTSGTIDFHRDTNRVITSGGVVDPGVIIVNLQTDASGNSETTAEQFVDWWSSQPQEQTAGISVGLLPDNGGQSTSGANTLTQEPGDSLPGWGVLQPTGSSRQTNQYDDLVLQAAQHDTVDVGASGQVVAVGGINASYSVTAKIDGGAYNDVRLVYMMQGANVPSSARWNEAERTIEIHAPYGMTAGEAVKLMRETSEIESRFEFQQLGDGTGQVTLLDTAQLSGGVQTVGSGGVAFFGGIDATEEGMRLVSDLTGSDQIVTVDQIIGEFQLHDDDGARSHFANGRDVDALLNGVRMTGNGRTATISSATLDLSFDVDESLDEGDVVQFTIRGGAAFQLGPEVDPSGRLTLGIHAINTTTLGGQTGRLYQLRSGGSADLAKNPALAARIAQEAIVELAEYRGLLGSWQSTTFQSNINVLTSTMESLVAAESQIRDTDFAAETTDLTRAQILVDSGIAVTGLGRQVSQLVLELLK